MIKVCLTKPNADLRFSERNLLKLLTFIVPEWIKQRQKNRS